MKKILAFILTIVLTTGTCSGFLILHSYSVNAAANSTEWPSEPDIYGKSAVLIEASTGTVLYSKKCHKKMYPASITKIMTALLTIENCEMDETVTFSENAVNSLSYDDANFGCQVGEEMSVKDCLYTLMLASANEVATALAEHIAGSVDKFSEMMNARAIEAGATDTHFTNANGLHDDDHYVTAYDMAMITKAAAQYPLFNEIVNTTTYTIGTNNKRTESAVANQRHKMVWPTSSYYYEGIIGGKTGYTDQSGTTLVTYAERDGMTLIAVVLNSSGTNVYIDTKSLLDYGFDNFNLVNVSENETRFLEEETFSLPSPFCTTTDLIYIDTESNLVIPKTTDFSALTSEISLASSEDSFSTITYKLGDKSVGTAKLKYESSAVPDESADALQETTITDIEASGETSQQSVSTETTKQNKRIKLPKFLFPVLIAVAIIIILIIIMMIHRHRLNRIRAMKRHRNRY